MLPELEFSLGAGLGLLGEEMLTCLFTNTRFKKVSVCPWPVVFCFHMLSARTGSGYSLVGVSVKCEDHRGPGVCLSHGG